jgi:hypothetical protein
MGKNDQKMHFLPLVQQVGWMQKIAKKPKKIALPSCWTSGQLTAQFLSKIALPSAFSILYFI